MKTLKRNSSELCWNNSDHESQVNDKTSLLPNVRIRKKKKYSRSSRDIRSEEGYNQIRNSLEDLKSFQLDDCESQKNSDYKIQGART